MNISKQFVEKYFKDQCTPKETRQVLKWFQTDEGQAFLQNRLDSDIEKIEGGKFVFPKLINTSKILDNIYSREAGYTTAPPATLNRKFYLKIAASIFLVALSAVLLVQNWPDTIAYKTNFGEKKSIVLPDSSQVIMNGNSSIRMSKNWEDSKREIWLEGEAYFSVVHTKNNSEFIVHTDDNFSIRVLGTEFNVATYNNTTKVALEKGKIQLNFKEKGEHSSLTMKPGEVVEFDQLSTYLIKKEAPVNTISSWKDDNMVFDETSVAEIARMLKSNHGMKLIVEDRIILEKRITGSVPNQNLDLFLRGLEEILDVKIVREEKLIYLNRKK